jgi:TRAP-type mannitol/chloroaromatic compound transport system permease large subunit
MLKNSLIGTLQITVMVFMIIAASKTFSSILAYTGATRGLLEVIKGLEVHPLLIILGMQLVVFFMGTFMETVSIMMICLPSLDVLGLPEPVLKKLYGGSSAATCRPIRGRHAWSGGMSFSMRSVTHWCVADS